MLKRVLLVLALSCPVAYAIDSPPTEASIKQLLEVAQAHKLVDAMMAQMDGFMKNAMQQATQGRSVSPQIQKDIDKRQSELMKVLKEELAWEKLEPLYIRVYQQSFSQDEVNGLVAFYKTPTGQALINKMPVVMQNTFNELQQRMAPMMQRIQRMQQDVVAEIQAETAKKGPG
jgi:uncharacterized protein